ncbi:hypothetical protein SCAZ3_08125 [Streptococcus canis FSL Z3-227]|uniref:Uncharacterized protein n=1 Tax=Streptococcus canis FSL Z3-227 TaxID=482234 RepID=A0AAV3FTN8_STRCB|nr:hypothetical protein SCAZ3_08125 [Streptococcus canis FSL Z3-227]
MSSVMFVFFDTLNEAPCDWFLSTDAKLETIRSFFKILKKHLNKGKIETK